MKLLGITGGIGMGKTTFASLLPAHGIPIVDTDQLARDLAMPGQRGYEEIVRRFGAAILQPDGQLNRRELGRLVFSEPSARRDLEAILHPKIRERWQTAARQWDREGRPAGAVVIPLLFETSAASFFDAILCVACSRQTQLERLRTRGWSVAQLDERLRAQWDIEEKIAHSHFVIWNEGAMENLAGQWIEISSFLNFDLAHGSGKR